MPCAAGKLCKLEASKPTAPDGHPCRGGCGDRLHGLCGEQEQQQGDNSEIDRICPGCASAKPSADASKSTASKRPVPATGVFSGGGSKRPKSTGGRPDLMSAPRTRLSLDQKMEILKLLDHGLSQEIIKNWYNCGARTVRQIKHDRRDLEKHAATVGKGACKTNRGGDFPVVDALVLELFQKTRVAKYSVTRNVVRSVGRSAKTILLGSAKTSDPVKKALENFKAGEQWAKNFVKRNNLRNKILQDQDGSVNHELVKKGMEEVRAACEKYPARNIFSVEETGIQWKLMPKATYLATFERRKTARFTKGMNYKDRVSAIVCSNARGTAKVDLAIIGKEKNPRCFRRRECPLKYYAQPNAWYDGATFLKWWREVFLPFVRRWTHEPVLLLMDGCLPRGDLVDNRGQVTVLTYPPNCTSVHQPMHMGIIAATKLNYRRKLLDVKVSTMLVAPTLRAEAKARKMVAGTAGLPEGHHPHVLDAADLLKSAWDSVTARTIARCFVKAKTLPEEMESELEAVRVKVEKNRSTGPVEDPAEKDPVAELAETLKTLSARVHESEYQGFPLDTEFLDLLANLRITPGEPPDEASIKAAQAWATVEDQEDVVEAMRLDAVESMTKRLEGKSVKEENVSDDDQEGNGDGGRMECGGGGAPPAYAELSSHFVALERAAEESCNGEAAFHLQKAKMATIAAHAASPVHRADNRAFARNAVRERVGDV